MTFRRISIKQLHAGARETGVPAANSYSTFASMQDPEGNTVELWKPAAKLSRGLRGALENACSTHAAADAHGHQAIPRVAPFEFAQNRRSKFRARAT
jgi:hypothetical protein